MGYDHYDVPIVDPTMTNSSDRSLPGAYTRDSVETYLRAAGAERLRIELAITEARARIERATRKHERLDVLVGQVQTSSTPEGSSNRG